MLEVPHAPNHPLAPSAPTTTPSTNYPSSEEAPTSYKAAIRPKSLPVANLSEYDIWKLRSTYPNPIYVPPPVIDDGSAPWSFALIGKFLGRPQAEKALEFLKSKWILEKD